MKTISYSRSGFTKLILSMAFLVCGQVSASDMQPELGTATQAKSPASPLNHDPLGRETPRGAVAGYLQSIDTGNFGQAAEFMDLRNLPPAINQFTPGQLARGLSVVLQRGLWIDLDQLSDRDTGDQNDQLPEYRDLLAELPVKEGVVPIYLQRVPDDSGGYIWKFSNATIAQLDVLYDTYRYHKLVEWLAKELPAKSFLGLELFKWVSVLGAMLIALPIVLLLAWFAARLLVSPGRPLHADVRRFLLKPVTVFVLVLIGNQVMHRLGVGPTAQKVSQSYTLITLATIWLFWQGVNLFHASYSHHLVTLGRNSSVALIRPLTTALKLLILLMGVLVWLDNLGVQITAVLTGLGIGGVAVALVLQKPLEDVFGAITLYTQQPIKIGDFGRFGSTVGTVEEISLRTTRIRTQANSLVSIPNMRLASEPIENLSARRKFLFSPVLRLEGDSSPDGVRELLKSLRQLLSEHEQVMSEGMRVRFTAITLAGFDISVFAYINVATWADYLEVAETLNFAILRLISTAGLKLTVQRAVLSTTLD